MTTFPFTMIFILKPGDCDLNDWSFKDENGNQDIGTKTKIEPGVIRWTYGSSSELSIKVRITGPTDQQIITYGGMPEGMGGLVENHYDENNQDTTGLVPRWYSLAPYQPIFYDDHYTILELSRANSDHIYHNIFYPSWVPNRSSTGARALLTVPMSPSLDFGEIQSVTKSYRANNTVIPIMCYGYRSSFVMDLGTTMSINLKYVRVQPPVPDDNSGDSRQWSNAKWQDYLRSLMDRWQMRTNGQQFYLLNPLDERLPQAPIDEIKGVNCYIASVPINYSDMGPHAISGSVELQAGTLYPKKEVPPMKTIYFRLGGSYTSQWPNPGDYRKMEYPINSVFRLPEYFWSKVRPIVNNTFYYISHWTIQSNGADSYSPKDLANVNDVTRVVNDQYTVYAMTTAMDISSMNQVLYNGPSNVPQTSSVENYFVVELLDGYDSATVELIAVGGGGGGASGYQEYSVQTAYMPMPAGSSVSLRKYFGGGGGGAVGNRDDQKTGANAYVINRKTRFDFVLGYGGQGGVGEQYPQTDSDLNTTGPVGLRTTTDIRYYHTGSDGGNTVIKVNTLTLATGTGGKGAASIAEAQETYDEGIGYTYTTRTGLAGTGNSGNGGKIAAAGHPNWGTWDDPLAPFVYYNGSSGSGTNPGAGGAKNKCDQWNEQHQSSNYQNKYYTQQYRRYASGGGGGGSSSYTTPSPSYGGSGAPALTSDTDNLSARHGSWGGGGGGGSAIMSQNVHRTTAGGNGGRGYIWARVVGGIITEKGW